VFEQVGVEIDELVGGLEISWAHHGPTAIANLVLLCSRHHHLLHLPGWHIKLLPDATVEVTRPDGQVLTDRPPGHLDRLFVTDTG
jgi:hypothetical protein